MPQGPFSQGPIAPGTAVSSGAVLAGIAWLNPSNALADDVAEATALFTTTFQTETLLVTGFDFAIPETATITGIQFEVKRRVLTAAVGDVKDRQIRVIKGGSVGSTVLEVADVWPSTAAYKTYGADGNLLGETWTPAQINASDFGLAVSAISVLGVTINTPAIDHVRATVYYTLPFLRGSVFRSVVRTR